MYRHDESLFSLLAGDRLEMASGESLALILGLPEAMQLLDRLGPQGVRGVLVAMKVGTYIYTCVYVYI